VAREILVPVENVVAIYARENGQGMAFEVSRLPARDGDTPASEDKNPSIPLAAVPPSKDEKADTPEPTDPDDNNPEPPKKGGRPTLTRIK
jgi:stringent starvation protein B